MSDFAVTIVGSSVERYAASPMLALRVNMLERSGVRVHAIALRGQVQIEPQRRRYEPSEAERLVELFGTPARYGDTLRPILWMHVSQTVLGFTGQTEFDLHIPCSYDFEVAAHKYLAGLEGGEIPLNVLFSGTVFVQGVSGVASEFVPWTCEARYRLPVSVWRDAMDAFFPNSAWLRLSQSTFDELYRYKTAQALPTWDAVVDRLLDAGKVET